jgi:hypothetical protein
MQIIAREIDQTEAPLLWREAEGFLSAAVIDSDPTNYLRNVQARIFSGLNTLWKLEDEDGKAVAYVVTVIYSPDGLHRTVQLYLATSESLQHLLVQMDQFIAWALKNKVDYIEVVGRKGWEKALRPYGFSHNHTSLIKRINEELH